MAECKMNSVTDDANMKKNMKIFLSTISKLLQSNLLQSYLSQTNNYFECLPLLLPPWMYQQNLENH